MTSPTRRDVLVFGGSATALGLSGCAILRGGAVHPQWERSKASLEGTVLKLSLDEVRRVGEGRVLEAKLEPQFKDLLFSPQADGTVLVVTAACTHNACTVDFKPSAKAWECPCHDSLFSLDGAVKKGPAKKALLVPASRVEEDRLVVDLALLKR
ncbi:MAG: Rieske 2Fe-2S domain-containing protein [Myxococcaceae bacterium]|nr:Rieske 2Fe-2S domain-containing protein [Myxococcaceae bacterium]